MVICYISFFFFNALYHCVFILSWAGELTPDRFLDVAFLPSRASFSPFFLKIVVKVRAS